MIPLSTEGNERQGPKPSFGVYAAETGGGFLGELAAVVGVSLAVFGVGEATGADWFDESSIPYGILWVAALVPAIPAGREWTMKPANTVLAPW